MLIRKCVWCFWRFPVNLRAITPSTTLTLNQVPVSPFRPVQAVSTVYVSITHTDTHWGLTAEASGMPGSQQAQCVASRAPNLPSSSQVLCKGLTRLLLSAPWFITSDSDCQKVWSVCFLKSFFFFLCRIVKVKFPSDLLLFFDCLCWAESRPGEEQRGRTSVWIWDRTLTGKVSFLKKR